MIGAHISGGEWFWIVVLVIAVTAIVYTIAAYITGMLIGIAHRGYQRTAPRRLLKPQSVSAQPRVPVRAGWDS